MLVLKNLSKNKESDPKDVIKFFQTRTRMEEAIKLKSIVVPSNAHAIFEVESQTKKGVTYDIDLTNLTCTCPDYQYRGTLCKHIQAALFYAKSHEECKECGGPLDPTDISEGICVECKNKEERKKKVSEEIVFIN